MIKAFSMRRISPGIMSDEGIVTITAAATIVPDRWTTVSVALNCPLLERGVPKFGSLYWPLRIFIDGKPQQLTTANLLPELEGYKEAMSVKLTPWYSEKARFTFGCYKDRFFKGMIANVRIWRGGRSGESIVGDSDQRLSSSQVSTAESKALGGYWPQDDGSGTVARDLTILHNDANLTDPDWAIVQ
jgi:hypothetical protein